MKKVLTFLLLFASSVFSAGTINISSTDTSVIREGFISSTAPLVNYYTGLSGTFCYGNNYSLRFLISNFRTMLDSIASNEVCDSAQIGWKVHPSNPHDGDNLSGSYTPQVRRIKPSWVLTKVNYNYADSGVTAWQVSGILGANDVGAVEYGSNSVKINDTGAWISTLDTSNINIGDTVWFRINGSTIDSMNTGAWDSNGFVIHFDTSLAMTPYQFYFTSFPRFRMYTSVSGGIVHSLSVTSKDTISIYVKDVYSGETGLVDTTVVYYNTANDIATADSTSRKSVSIGDPDSTNVTGLSNNVQYWFWYAIYDDNGWDTSSAMTATTYDTVGQVLTKLDSTSTTFTIEDAYVSNTIDTFWLIWDINTDTIGASFASDITVLESPDTLQATSLSAITKYYFWCMINDSQYGRNLSAIDSITTTTGDSEGPDPHDAFAIQWVLSLDPDSVQIIIGAVDSTDYDTTIIRWDTASIPSTISSGQLLWQGGAVENDTSNYIVNSISQPDWVYFSVFAGDEVPNWSTAVSDSVYFPSCNGGGDCLWTQTQIDSVLLSLYSIYAALDTLENQDNWGAHQTTSDSIFDSLMSVQNSLEDALDSLKKILDSIYVIIVHIDTNNFAYVTEIWRNIDTSITVDTSGLGQWLKNNLSSGAAVWSTAEKDTVMNRTLKSLDSIIAILDTLQTGFPSRSIIGIDWAAITNATASKNFSNTSFYGVTNVSGKVTVTDSTAGDVSSLVNNGVVVQGTKSTLDVLNDFNYLTQKVTVDDTTAGDISFVRNNPDSFMADVSDLIDTNYMDTALFFLGGIEYANTIAKKYVSADTLWFLNGVDTTGYRVFFHIGLGAGASPDSTKTYKW